MLVKWKEGDNRPNWSVSFSDVVDRTSWTLVLCSWSYSMCLVSRSRFASQRCRPTTLWRWRKWGRMIGRWLWQCFIMPCDSNAHHAVTLAILYRHSLSLHSSSYSHRCESGLAQLWFVRLLASCRAALCRYDACCMMSPVTQGLHIFSADWHTLPECAVACNTAIMQCSRFFVIFCLICVCYKMCNKITDFSCFMYSWVSVV